VIPAKLLLATLVVLASLCLIGASSGGAASQSAGDQGSTATPVGEAKPGRAGPDPAAVAKLLSKSRSAPQRVIVDSRSAAPRAKDIVPKLRSPPPRRRRSGRPSTRCAAVS
jgi:hypothetical protein